MTAVSNGIVGGVNRSSGNINTTKSKNTDENNSFSSVMDIASGGRSNKSEGDKTNKVGDKSTSFTADNQDTDKRVSKKQDECTDTKGVSSENEKLSENEKSLVDDEKSTAVGETEENLTDATTSDELISEIIDSIQAIIDYISKMLGKTVEEVNEQLDVNEMSAVELTDIKNVKDFVLSIMNKSEVDILIDEDVKNILNDITAFSEEILSGTGLSNEQLASFIEENSDIWASKSEGIVNQSFGDTQKTDTMALQTSSDTEVKDTATGEIQEVTKELNITNDSSNEASLSQFEDDNDMPWTQKTVEPGKGEDENVLNKLSQAIDNAMTKVADSEAIEAVDKTSEADIVRQVIDEIKANISKEVTSLELKLNPEHLGKVQINVSSRNGIMQAQIVAESEAAKTAIENSIEALKEAFDNKELKVDAIEVMVATYSFDNNGQKEQNETGNQKKSSNGGKSLDLNDDIIEEDMTEAQKLEASIMQSQGNSVSYKI